MALIVSIRAKSSLDVFQVLVEAEGPRFPPIVFGQARDTEILVETGDGGGAARPLEHSSDSGSIQSQSATA